MKKLAFIVVLMLIVTLMLSACDTSENTDNINARKLCDFKRIFRNVDVGVNSSDDIFVDLNTGVIYFRNWKNGFTPIYNADGTLKLWKGDIPE